MRMDLPYLGAQILEPLPRAFYERSVLRVARDCLGKLLVHQFEDETLIGRIVEAEAYRGPEDRAAHSYGGLRSARTEVMFGRAGIAYVFLIYGLHCNFNIVTGAVDEPQAVLIRAVEPIRGMATMAAARRNPSNVHLLTNGPGKLCAAFGIDRGHNGADLCAPPLYLAEGPRPARILQTTRIGIDYAGVWAKRPWRWLDADSPYVSKPRQASGRM